jgi:hypothetical protein
MSCDAAYMVSFRRSVGLRLLAALVPYIGLDAACGSLTGG